MKIRFYDNEETNFKGMDKYHIETILVDDNTPNPLIKKDIEKFEKKKHITITGITPMGSYPEIQTIYYDNYLSQLTDPIRRQHFLEVFTHAKLNNMNKELKLVSLGITNRQINDLIKWCKDFKSEPKIVFFDWDRTLTVAEGFAVLKNRPILDPPISDEAILEYMIFMFGGDVRFNKIKRLFNFLHRMQVNIFILTNNSGAVKYKDSFLKTIQFIDPLFSSQNLYGTLGTYFDKHQMSIKSKKTKLLQNKQTQWNLTFPIQYSKLPSQKQIDQFITKQQEQF
jgi:hypothetical protein